MYYYDADATSHDDVVDFERRIGHLCKSNGTTITGERLAVLVA